MGEARHSVISRVLRASLLVSSLSHRIFNFGRVTAARRASLLSKPEAKQVLMACEKEISKLDISLKEYKTCLPVEGVDR